MGLSSLVQISMVFPAGASGAILIAINEQSARRMREQRKKIFIALPSAEGLLLSPSHCMNAKLFSAKAKWIWIADPSRENNTFACFRKTIDVKKADRAAVI